MSSLSETADVVKASTISGVNGPQLVCDEAGNVFVEQFDWQTFLIPYFKPLIYYNLNIIFIIKTIYCRNHQIIQLIKKQEWPHVTE